MRKPVCWVQKLEDRVKLEIRVSFPGNGRIRWQSQRSDEDRWVYDFTPTAEQWDFLVSKVEDRYCRRAAKYGDVESVRAARAAASKAT